MFVVVWVECLLGYQLVAVINLKAFLKLSYAKKTILQKRSIQQNFILLLSKKGLFAQSRMRIRMKHISNERSQCDKSNSSIGNKIWGETTGQK